MSTQPSGQPRATSRAYAAVLDLHPAYFAFVMATGIISTGTYPFGPSLLSVALLVVPRAGLGILALALVARLILYRPEVAADIRAPDQVSAFFTITAGRDVAAWALVAAAFLSRLARELSARGGN